MTDGSCWFCGLLDEDLVFDCEFDTYVHKECVYLEWLKGDNSEADIMFYLISDDILYKPKIEKIQENSTGA